MQRNTKLYETVAALMASGKGILAADESDGTAGKRLAMVRLENTPENRQDFRELLFTAPDIEKYLSGVIMFDSSIRNETDDGVLFADVLTAKGIVPGIKVDRGTRALQGFKDEEITQGLDDLDKRFAEYYDLGARFAKWRAVLQITADGCPSDFAIQENAWGLARYARTCQNSGLVPIIEPEILMDGDHSIERTAEAQEKILTEVYKACEENGVFLEGSLLKPSMIVSGADNANKASPEEVAKITVRTMDRCVPDAVPGIMFLSGGLTEEDASVYLNTMNRMDRKSPWSMTFSYGRALQQSCLQAWKDGGDEAGKKALMARAQANSEASMGDYVAGSQPSSQATLFEAGYKY
mgnify:CR=1 FL=1